MSLDLAAYEKARSGAVVFNRGGAVIEVSGADHAAFLHNILSQDMLAMQTNDWRETALLSATSHVLAYMSALKLKNSILLISVPGTAAKICALLDKFLITEDVQIEDVSQTWNLFEIWGPHAARLIHEKSPQSMIYKPEGNQGLRTLVLAQSSSLFENDHAENEELRETLRVENGILEFGRDFNETTMLSETHLEKKSASETKGCYPGQEVVAKIETYKRLNRGFVQLSWDSKNLPEPNSIIYSSASDEEIGRLTSRAYSPFYKKTVGLGWLKRGFFEQPVEVSIKSETAIPAQTALLKN